MKLPVDAVLATAAARMSAAEEIEEHARLGGTTVTKREKIERFFQLTRSDANVSRILGAALGCLGDSDEAVKVRNRVLAVGESRIGELRDQMIAVYEEALAEEDVDALVAFYESPSGTRYLSVQSEMMGKCLEMGNVWGESVAEQVRTEMGF